MSPDPLTLAAAEQARTVVLQMMAERSLGSFAAKISLASRLALIDQAVAKALHALRGVRNDFAHSAGHSSLAAPHHHRKRQAPVYAEKPAPTPSGPRWWRSSKPRAVSMPTSASCGFQGAESP
jgi:hypothetical protein